MHFLCSPPLEEEVTEQTLLHGQKFKDQLR
jgi:hypothetical protein